MPKNNFMSVANAVKRKYPKVNFCSKFFGQGKGDEKLTFIEQKLAVRQPVLVSISNEVIGKRGWHIMPVVDATDNKLILLMEVDVKQGPKIETIPKNEFVQIHKTYNGGNDVAFLESWE